MSASARSEILVVGAGLIGRASAYYLSLQGAHVRLFDKDPSPSATSRASLGVLTHANGRDDALGSFYRDAHALHGELALRLRRETGLEVGWAALGGLDLVVTEEDEAEARRSLDFNLQRGCPAQWLDRIQMRQAEPRLADEVEAGLYFPGDHRVDPERLGEALLAAAAGLGAQVELGTAVRQLRAEPAGGVAARVETAGGGSEWVGADGAVLAAGAWSRALAPVDEAEVSVRPIRGQQARYAGPEAPRHVLRHGGYHILPDGDRTVVGATVEEVGFDTTTTREAADAFGQALERMVGPGAELLEQRAGLRPKPRKGRPVIGPVPGCEQIVAATGHYKSGVLMAPLTGQVVAQWLLSASPGRGMEYFSVVR